MADAPFAPHGLVVTKELARMYKFANLRPIPEDDYDGDEDDESTDEDEDSDTGSSMAVRGSPRPAVTVATPEIPPWTEDEGCLFKTLFETVVFPGDNFTIKLNYNKKVENLKCALIIDVKVRSSTGSDTPLCVSVHSAASNRILASGAFSSEYHTARLEKGALRECQAMLRANPSIQKVFAVTVVATKIRCWFFKRGSCRLHGYWNNADSGKLQYYLDVGSEEAKALLELAFAKMKHGVAADEPGLTAVSQGFRNIDIA